jgi:hypothetical protein
MKIEINEQSLETSKLRRLDPLQHRDKKSSSNKSLILLGNIDFPSANAYTQQSILFAPTTVQTPSVVYESPQPLPWTRETHLPSSHNRNQYASSLPAVHSNNPRRTHTTNNHRVYDMIIRVDDHQWLKHIRV